MLSANYSALRWRILALVFFATTINYLDRILLSVLIPTIQEDLHLSVQAYANLTGFFQLAYTVGFFVAGKFIGRSAVSLGFWRAMPGSGEAGNFPAAIKSVAELFPKKDRAFATGTLNVEVPS